MSEDFKKFLVNYKPSEVRNPFVVRTFPRDGSSTVLMGIEVQGPTATRAKGTVVEIDGRRVLVDSNGGVPFGSNNIDTTRSAVKFASRLNEADNKKVVEQVRESFSQDPYSFTNIKPGRFEHSRAVAYEDALENVKNILGYLGDPRAGEPEDTFPYFD